MMEKYKYNGQIVTLHHETRNAVTYSDGENLQTVLAKDFFKTAVLVEVGRDPHARVDDPLFDLIGFLVIAGLFAVCLWAVSVGLEVVK